MKIVIDIDDNIFDSIVGHGIGSVDAQHIEHIIMNGTPYEERPKGKWLSHYEYCAKHGCCPSALIAFWWCAQCEQGVSHPTNFCPNCGADMRGKEK